MMNGSGWDEISSQGMNCHRDRIASRSIVRAMNELDNTSDRQEQGQGQGQGQGQRQAIGAGA